MNIPKINLKIPAKQFIIIKILFRLLFLLILILIYLIYLILIYSDFDCAPDPDKYFDLGLYLESPHLHPLTHYSWSSSILILITILTLHHDPDLYPDQTNFS